MFQHAWYLHVIIYFKIQDCCTYMYDRYLRLFLRYLIWNYNTYSYMTILQHMYMYIHNYLNTCMCMCIHTYIYTYIYTYVRTYIHTYMHAYIHTYIYACMHVCIHVCIHSCIHTYMHTYTIQDKTEWLMDEWISSLKLILIAFSWLYYLETFWRSLNFNTSF